MPSVEDLVLLLEVQEETSLNDITDCRLRPLAMMQAWADYLDRLKDGGKNNTVPTPSANVINIMLNYRLDKEVAVSCLYILGHIGRYRTLSDDLEWIYRQQLEVECEKFSNHDGIAFFCAACLD